MHLSIITVALNAADDLPITIESVLAQDHPDIEFIMVDGGSWDATPEVLKLYDDEIDQIHVIDDGGIYYAMNEAVSFASGEFVLFLNAGDRLHQADSISRLAARWDGRADVLYGNHIYAYNWVEAFHGSTDFSIFRNALRRGQLSPEITARFPAHQATATRRSLLAALKYDTAWRICADHDFLLRAATNGARLQYVDEIVSIYRGGGMSARRNALCRLEWNAIYRRYSERPAKIDAFYFGEELPFEGKPSQTSGGPLSGLSPLQKPRKDLGLPDPFRYVDAGGFRVVSPAFTGTANLTLEGWNFVQDQVVTIYVNDKAVLTKPVPKGTLQLQVPFKPPLEPRSIIEVVPQELDRPELVNRAVSLAITAVSFVSGAVEAPEPRSRGTRIVFNLRNAKKNADLLGAGWWAAEENHTWSSGELSELRVASHDFVDRIVLQLRANPLIRDQKLRITLNGEQVLDTRLAGGPEPQDVTVPVRAGFRSDGSLNALRLQPSPVRKPASDTRTLGVALVSMTLA